MTARAISLRFRRSMHNRRLVQIALLVLFWLLGEAVARLTGLPLPGGIVGMVLVLLLLASHRLSLFSLKRGAEWFLAEMLLFFVPAVLAVVDHGELLGLLGLKVLLVILGGTMTVMGVTALTVDLCYRWSARHDRVEPLLG